MIKHNSQEVVFELCNLMCDSKDDMLKVKETAQHIASLSNIKFAKMNALGETLETLSYHNCSVTCKEETFESDSYDSVYHFHLTIV